MASDVCPDVAREGGEMVNKFNLIHTEAGSSSGPVSCPLSSVLSLAADICLMALT